MLSFIRSLARSPIVGGFIIALLVAAFALWGVEGIFGGGNAAVLVGPERVTVQQVNREYENQIRQIQLENPRFTRDQAEQFGLGDQVVRRLTVQAAIDAKAKELGLAVSDQTLAEVLQAVPAFQNPFTNRFDRQTYLSVIGQQGFRERVFEADFARQLRRSQYVEAILGGTRAPDVFARARQAYQQERRALRALLIPPALAGDPGQPDDETLQAFIDENAQAFRLPEQRRFTLVRVSPELYYRDVEVDEEELLQLYEFRLETGQLADPATRTLTQWPAPDRDAAEQAVSRISAGEAPAEAAAALGLGDAVEFEDVQAHQVPDSAVANAAFARQAGETAAVEGRLGWRVIHVRQAVDPDIPSLEDIRDELVDELSRDQAEGMMLDALAALEDARGAGALLEDAAASAGIPAERYDFITRNGVTVNGERASTLLQETEILEQIFELPLGFDGDLSNFGENGYYVVRVDAVEEPRMPALDEVREDAAEFWRIRTIDDRLQSVLDEALERVRAGEDINGVADSLGAPVRVEAATLNRTETAGPFNRQLVGAAFAQEKGAVFEARAGDQRTRAVVIVDDITGPRPAPMPAEARLQLAEELEDDLAASIESALLNTYDIRSDQRLIDIGLGRIDPSLQ